MNENKAVGLALTVGSVMLLVTMGLHPTGGDLEGGSNAAMVRLAVVVHWLGIASIPFFLYGFWGLTRRLDNAAGRAALSVYAVAALAVVFAGILNGLAGPRFIQRYAESEGAEREAARAVLVYGHYIAVALERLYTAAVSFAVALWSLSMLRRPAPWRQLAAVGLTLGLAALLTQFTGLLGIGVHGFGLFVLGQSLWVVAVGIFLWRDVPAGAS